MAFLLAQIIGIMATVVEIVIMQFKNIKYILTGQCLSNFLIVIQYALLGGMSGAAVCVVATIQTLILYIYRKKEKHFPAALTILFLLLYLFSSLMTFKSPADILSCLAALLFAISVTQTESSKYRIIILINSILWIIYDINTKAFTMITTHAIAVVSVIIGMIRLDLKTHHNTQKSEEKQ